MSVLPALEAMHEAFRSRGLSLGSLCLARMESPLGALIAGSIDEGVCLLAFADGYALDPLPFGPASPHLDRLETELAQYFAGDRLDFDLALAAPGTAFQGRVWAALREIPYGETRGYAELARALGDPAAGRAVAQANARNRIDILIPCHRVLRSDGSLGGYNGGLWRKESLLRLEASGHRGNIVL